MARHPMIHPQQVRRFILDYAERTRAHRYTQVSQTVYDQVEAAVRQTCRNIVRSQPSAGRTIR